MKNRGDHMKKIIMISLIAILLFTNTGSIIYAKEVSVIEASTKTLDLTARSAIVMEQNSGSIIFEKNKDKKLPPASVTKIMSLLLVFESLESGRIKLKDTVTVSEHAASMGGSQVFLEAGEKQDVHTLIKCVVVSSANDAVVALAEHICGSEKSFVERMNQEAKKLGMHHTTFKNACGLDEDGHVTTAYDIALMTRELARKHKKIFQYTKIWMDTILHKTKKGEKEFGLSNTNKLIRQYQGCTGMKTGSTSKAGFCLSATATRNKIHMIAVVMDSESSKTRVKEASELLDHGFSNCRMLKDITTKKEIGKILIKGGEEEKVTYKNKVLSQVLDIKSDTDKIKKRIKIYQVKAPVKKGDRVGEILYLRGNKIIKREEIKAERSVKKQSFLSLTKKIITCYFQCLSHFSKTVH